MRMKMQAVGDLIFGIYRGTPQEGDWIIACLEGAWPAILGDRLARTCRPAAWENNILTVEILDPDWSQTLTGMERELQDRLCSATNGEVRRLEFRALRK